MPTVSGKQHWIPLVNPISGKPRWLLSLWLSLINRCVCGICTESRGWVQSAKEARKATSKANEAKGIEIDDEGVVTLVGYNRRKKLGKRFLKKGIEIDYEGVVTLTNVMHKSLSP